MARTKASVGAKVASGKSSKARCCVASAPSSSGRSGSSDRSSKNNSSGGNPVCPRETPKWQRPITNFFIQRDDERTTNKDCSRDDDNNEVMKNGDVDVENGESSSSSKPKRKNVIQSDSEDEILTEKPKNTVLDETLELETLNGENSHKIDEYYSKGGKGKGVGKKTKGKENRRDSKRGREEIEGDADSVSKKVKVN